MPPQEGSDEFWVEEARRRPEAFAELVRRYQDRIFSYALRMTGSREDAQDLAQETFIRVYAHLDRFRTEERFSPWIYRIATNLCLSHLKRRTRTAVATAEPDPDALPGGPEAALEEQEARHLLQQAILDLPEHYRTVILLRHVEELSYEEITRVLGLPLGTVKTRLFRARELLQARLQTYRYGDPYGLRPRPGVAPSLP
ncbi:MAG: sigma-70 family RNA polymerase sigma factor [Chloroflexi bacterium]|nr:sigma-70 family RNA polymerase sigma factor [Chloroflexota bacterium]